MAFVAAPAPLVARPCAAARRCQGRSRASRAVACAKPEKVYVGKGKYIEEDPNKLPGRDPGGLVGGWAGGEKALKEWAPKAAAEVAGSSVQAAQPSAAASDGGLSGPDDIYVGKGRYIKGNKKMFPDKELGGLTGGWAGGEVGLKVKPDAFPVNSRVKVKGAPPAPWMQNALFKDTAMALAGRQGVVTKVNVGNGAVKLTVRLDADASQGYRVVVLNEGDLEAIAQR